MGSDGGQHPPTCWVSNGYCPLVHDPGTVGDAVMIVISIAVTVSSPGANCTFCLHIHVKIPLLVLPRYTADDNNCMTYSIYIWCVLIAIVGDNPCWDNSVV